jgi:hypothetical protein
MLKDNYVILFVLICPIQDDLSMDGENPSRLSLGLHVGNTGFHPVKRQFCYSALELRV